MSWELEWAHIIFSPSGLASQVLYVDKGNSSIQFLHEIESSELKYLFFLKLLLISTDLIILNSTQALFLNIG